MSATVSVLSEARWRRICSPITALLCGVWLWSMPALAHAKAGTGKDGKDGKAVTHLVAKGQTLTSIARRYRTTADAIRDVNGLRAGQLIKPGLVLVIPEKGKEAEAAKKAAELRAARGASVKDGRKGTSKDAKNVSDAKDVKDVKDAKDKPSADKGKKKGKGADKDKPEPLVHKPKRPGLVRLVRGTEQLDLQLLTKHGKLVPSSLAGLSRMLRHAPSGSKTDIDPRLATLIGMVSDHFGGRPLHVVSGYRPYSPTQYTKHSNHNLGRAFDFTVEGVPNTVLRDFCRTFRNAGVGYYPNSTFVHLDVRTTKTFWIDYSRAGEPPRYDSPVAQATADESTGDVDSSSGTSNPSTQSNTNDMGEAPKETGATSAPSEVGSKNTQPPPSQPIDSSIGNQRTPDTTNAKPSE